MPADCGPVVIDTPAAVDSHALPDLTRGVDAVLVPVMPSDIDIHATARCIADLLLIAKIRRSESARSAESGLGVYEMPRWQVQQDLPQWLDVLSWLGTRRRNQPARSVSVARRTAEPDRLPMILAGSLVSATPE
jgi:hypothetical protein